MSSRMTCTSLERLAPLPSVPPRPPAPAPVPGPLPFRDERRAAARSFVVPRKLHIISTPAISVPLPLLLAPSALPPPARLVMCAVKLVQLPSQCSIGGDGGGAADREAKRQTECRHREFVFLDAPSYPCERVLILFSQDDLRHEHNGRQAMRKNATVVLSSLLLAIFFRAVTNISVSRFFTRRQ